MIEFAVRGHALDAVECRDRPAPPSDVTRGDKLCMVSSAALATLPHVDIAIARTKSMREVASKTRDLTANLMDRERVVVDSIE